MNKHTYLSLLISVVLLGGCGSGSDDSNQVVSKPEIPTPVEPEKPKPPTTETALKCDRGILLNSTLSASSIYDEPLYMFEADYTGSMKDSTIYADETKRDGQMLYHNSLPIFNTNAEDLDLDNYKANSDSIFYTLNRHGLLTDQYYQKQHQGWPIGYLIASDGYKISQAGFDDQCSLQNATHNVDYERIDLSGKKIADIFPQGVQTHYPENKEYLYVQTNLAYLLKEDKNAFAQLLADTDVFPQGSFVYVPKSVVYPDTHIFFEQGYYAIVDSFDQWIARNKKDRFKQDIISGLKVLYPVDSNGNAVFNATDPLVEMNGKLHDGEWIVKGDVVSTSYGDVASDDGFGVNYSEKGEFAMFNASSYEFFKQKLLNYYKAN